MLNEITALDIRFVSREDVLIPIKKIFVGFELLVRFFFLKCSISVSTGLSISNSSGVGLSGKFEQLDSPTPVSDLIELISLMKFFTLQTAQDTNLVLTIRTLKIFILFNFSYSFHEKCVSQFPSTLDCD